MKDLRKLIETTLRKYLNEQQTLKESWYHGTPDAREIEKIGGFTHKIMSVDYVTDPNGLKELQINMNNARENDDMDLYHKLLNNVANYKKDFKYKKPLFLTDKHSVAKTYADPQRAFDYQNAIEKVYEVDVHCNKIAKIVATGDRFRFISVDKVKRGFMNSGISEEEIDKLISMFNYYVKDNKGIKTDVIAAIGNSLNFDCIDVVGVLDSYHGGTVKSTVRMVLDPTNVKIKRREFVEEEVKNKTTNSIIWYHGSNSPKLTINTVEINNNSPEMFYGNAFYVASDINLAKRYGKYIYEVEFDGNFYNVKSREMLGTYGTFEQYLKTLSDSYEENILDNIKENPKYWLNKLKIKKDELIELYKDGDSNTLVNYFLQNNKDELFEEYVDNQTSLRTEYEENGYDGLIDITQAAIFNPQKTIKKLELLK